MVTEKGRIIDRREMLTIKLKALVAEARIIRQAERRMPGDLGIEMRLHRIRVVRSASRHTHLALGFIRGRAYGQLEATSRTQPDWEQVKKMVRRYSAMWPHLTTSGGGEMVDRLIDHWAAHPAWKAPSLLGIIQYRQATRPKPQSSESFGSYALRLKEHSFLKVAEAQLGI